MTWNPGAEAMFGVRAEDAIGRSYAELVVPEDEQDGFRPRGAEVHAGRTLTVRTTRRRPDGSRFPAQVSVALSTLLDGSWSGSLSLIRDITDLVETEHALEERAAQLERSNSEVERFAYAASHDLQEPLQSIKLSAGAVIATAEERLDADERELIGLIDIVEPRLSDQTGALMQVAQVALGAGPGQRVKLSGRGPGRGGRVARGGRRGARRDRRPRAPSRGRGAAHGGRARAPERDRERDQVPARGRAAARRDRGGGRRADRRGPGGRQRGGALAGRPGARLRALRPRGHGRAGDRDGARRRASDARTPGRLPRRAIGRVPGRARSSPCRSRSNGVSAHGPFGNRTVLPPE